MVTKKLDVLKACIPLWLGVSGELLFLPSCILRPMGAVIDCRGRISHMHSPYALVALSTKPPFGMAVLVYMVSCRALEINSYRSFNNKDILDLP
jgi:hypothetical protein